MVTRMILNETSYFGFGAITKIVDELKSNNFPNCNNKLNTRRTFMQ